MTSARESKIPLMMLEVIPSGYYAVRPDSETPYEFMRLARPNYGKRKGMTLVQTQHSEQLVTRWVWNPQTDPRFQVNIYSSTIEDKILLMIANARSAGRAYAKEIGRCQFCGKKLTDERSRWYGFGPECEKRAESLKDEIDDENEGSYEYLKAKGLVNI